MQKIYLPPQVSIKNGIGGQGHFLAVFCEGQIGEGIPQGHAWKGTPRAFWGARLIPVKSDIIESYLSHGQTRRFSIETLWIPIKSSHLNPGVGL